MRGPLLAACAALALLPGCIGLWGGTPASVTNRPDLFVMEGKFLDRSATERHAWENRLGTAGVFWDGDVAAGSLALSLQDAAGRQVHEQRFVPGSGEASATARPGEPGKWQVHAVFSGFTGNVTLVVRAAAG